MVDEKAAVTNEKNRWPLILFLSPIGAILLSTSNPEVTRLTELAAGLTIVCGGLWVVWFCGLLVEDCRGETSVVSFLSKLFVAVLSGYLLASGWKLALARIAKEWGVAGTQVEQEINSISISLLKLGAYMGVIPIILFIFFSQFARRIAVGSSEFIICEEQESVWVMTALGQLAAYLALRAFS